MTKEQRKRLKLLSALRAEKLSDAKKKVVCDYSEIDKLKAVINWRSRMALSGVATKDVAEVLGIPSARVSEWLHFTYEPSMVNFNKFEEALNELGV